MSRTLVLVVAAALFLSACAKPATTPPADAAADPEAVPTRPGVVHRGQSWGLFIQETAPLAQTVAGNDGTGTVTYREIVPNTPDEPASGPALGALAALISAPE
jgi:hypothetical protein